MSMCMNYSIVAVARVTELTQSAVNQLSLSANEVHCADIYLMTA